MLKLEPFEDREALFSAAASVWWALDPVDWLEAFATHPKIGAAKLSGWASQEQRGVDSAPRELLERLARANEQYEQRFGWIFLINATGKTAPQILDGLEARLKNARAEEIRIAAAEQAKITELRLGKLLDV